MVNLTDVHERKLAMVAWAEKPDGTDDVVVFTGTAHWDGGHLTMLRGGGCTVTHARRSLAGASDLK